MKRLAGVMVPPAFGIILLGAGGCGDGPAATDPAIGQQRKQARIEAYGKTGFDTSKKAGIGAPSTNAQAEARQKAMRGGR